ncbi:uncharacterized protein LOC131848867 [Achroia grisella]|uniref:uncharacterized protein LOC131848867 n=1 Tax=Achroia grisella TaxID=688607 RepID=UPI0027D2F8A0|nr:uncharacterized protein LOC131848867 [Achroia grisella]
MEESEAKICQNCKREIPAENFTIHSVHCARNIRVCPVCKEPVSNHELQDHHEKFHKLLPCKQCGESVCGTDLEDHIRDSCGHTVKSCRFCELELPRRDLPPHENYCGVRTEQCPECREWVMIKYKQLHLDSNHGFLRLDDDPAPQTKKDVPKPTNILMPGRPLLANNNIINATPVRPLSTNSNITNNNSINGLKVTNIRQNRERAEVQSRSSASPFEVPSSSRDSAVAGGSGGLDIRKVPLKRTNDQPQINTAVAATDKVNKDLQISRGAIKKRVAPKPPPPDPKRDLPYYKALQRHQDEERQRQEQSALNISLGLPPVLSPAAKLDKLRKIDALHNREVESVDYKNKLQGRVWLNMDSVSVGNQLGSSSSDPSIANRLNEFRDLKPMSPQEFTERSTESRSPRPLMKQLASLIKFLEMNPDAAKGPSGNVNAKIRWFKKWEKLSKRLNQLGGTTKSPKKWMKYWIKIRSAIKKKAAALNEAGSNTDGVQDVTQLQKRILAIIGYDSFAASSRRQPDIDLSPPNTPHDESKCIKIENEDPQSTQSRAITIKNEDVDMTITVNREANPSSSVPSTRTARRTRRTAGRTRRTAGRTRRTAGRTRRTAGRTRRTAGRTTRLSIAPNKTRARSLQTSSTSRRSQYVTITKKLIRLTEQRLELDRRLIEALERSSEGHRITAQAHTALGEGFKQLQLDRASVQSVGGVGGAEGDAGGDRFNEIKSSLRELRRGLNEVTAPYNSNSNTTVNNVNVNPPPQPPRRMWSHPQIDEEPQLPQEGDSDVQLPCEFCDTLVPADRLVLHQTGCRPDLAQLRPRVPKVRRNITPTPAPPPQDIDPPVIPCEFCTESLPVYLISEHQERCRRESNLLYPD